MKKPTNWDVYFHKQMRDVEMRGLIEEELKALRIGAQLAKIRQRKRLSQTALAARVGMSGPNISRIENSPSQNMTIGTLVRLARALGREVEIGLPSRRTGRRRPRVKGRLQPMTEQRGRGVPTSLCGESPHYVIDTPSFRGNMYVLVVIVRLLVA